MGGFASAIDAFKHDQQAAAEAVVWEGHTADSRERTAESTGHRALAVARDGMGYCCAASRSLRERVGVREERTIYQGETCVSIPTRNIFLSAWFVCALLVCIASTTVWSDSDKTIVDLQRGLPDAPSRYHRPRAEQRYQYDKTEIDLAVPLPPQPAEEQRGSQRPATLITPTPAPPNTPPQAPLPGGAR